MFWMIADKVGSVLSPVLIHFLVSNVIVILFETVGLHVDAAFLTSITAVLVLPLFLWMYKADRDRPAANEKKEEPQEKRIPGFGDYLLLAGFGVICNVLLTMLLNFLLQGSSLSNEAQESLFGSSFFMQLFGIGMITPVMEEVLFRGLVYKRLKGYTNNVWAAAAGSAALFAVYHGNVIQMLFAFPMGILLGVLYQRWDTVKAPAVFHAAVNISSVLISAYTQGLL